MILSSIANRSCSIFMLSLFSWHLNCITILAEEISCSSSNTNECVKTNTKKEQKIQECNIYLAESSIPNAGLGIYTSRTLQYEDTIEPYQITLPLIDAKYQHPHDSIAPLQDYTWEGTDTGIHLECLNAQTVIPGAGMALNCAFGGLNNVKFWPMYTKHDVMLDSTNVGAGAFSEYKLHRFYASQEIPAGSEIFISYGNEYFQKRGEAHGYSAMPFDEHYEEADKIIQEFSQSQDLSQKIWEEIRNATSLRTKTALPEKVSELKSLLDAGGSAKYALPNRIRSISWLQENGMCMDHLVAKTSLIPHAGRGAFATRFLPKGSLVAPAPLVHFTNKTTFDLYHVIFDKRSVSNFTVDYNHPRGKQLLYNYCFGHKDSSLLLFPYSSAVQFINHDSEKANVELRWSSSKWHNEDRLNFSIHELAEQKKSGLILEFVAKRDIQPNEEVLLDYGAEWEEAWKEHVMNWNKKNSTQKLLPVSHFKKDTIIRTLKEQEDNPYPNNLQTACYYGAESETISNERKKAELKIYYKPSRNKFSMNLHPCDILERLEHENEFFYNVHIFRHPAAFKHEMKEASEVVYHIPRDAITFISKPYHSNIFIEGVFRHTIQIPDDIFPSAWKNLKK